MVVGRVDKYEIGVQSSYFRKLRAKWLGSQVLILCLGRRAGGLPGKQLLPPIVPIYLLAPFPVTSLTGEIQHGYFLGGRVNELGRLNKFMPKRDDESMQILKNKRNRYVNFY